MTAKLVRQVTLGSLIDALAAKKAEISAKEAEKKKLEDEAKALKDQIIAKAKEEGVTQATGKLARATISDKTYPQVTDWDKFYEFIHDNKFYQLLYRRPASVACNELFESQGTIPGVEKFVKREVNITGV